MNAIRSDTERIGRNRSPAPTVLLHAFFVSLGVIGVLGAMVLRPRSEVFSDFLISIGSTLIATSLLAYLYQQLGARTLTDQLGEIHGSLELMRKSLESGIINLWQERRHIPSNTWNDFTKVARQEVWLFGVAEYGFAADEAFHEIMAQGVSRGCTYKILLLDSASPSAKYWDDRDKTVPSKIRAATEKFTELIAQNQGKPGRIEMRVYDEVPSVSIIRADGQMIVTLYISCLRGDDSPTILVQSVHDGLFARYARQFDRTWAAARIVESPPPQTAIPGFEHL